MDRTAIHLIESQPYLFRLRGIFLQSTGAGTASGGGLNPSDHLDLLMKPTSGWEILLQ